jgi:hypothetical protein
VTTVPPGGRRRVLVCGLLLAAVYLLVGGLSFRAGLLPRVPVLDGLPPPAPYQWVNPPPDRRRDNKPPEGVTDSIQLTSIGSAGSVSTLDSQASVIFDTNSVPVPPGQSSVSVTLSPLDPATVGPPPSGGYHYDSNAYRFAAAYEPSNQPVTTMSVTIVLSYATSADRVIRWNQSGWDALPSTPAGGNQLFAPTDHAGIFATATTKVGHTVKQPKPVLLVLEVAAPFAVIAVILLVVLGRRRSSTARRRS